jgi:uncharacterized membrane protein
MGNYNEFAGQNLDRLAAISDGIFAVGMTLLVLDLHTPVASLIHSDADLGRNLLKLAPNLAVYVMSFLTLGIFWVGQQTQLNLLTRSDRNLAWLHLGFLFCVTLMPFSTELIGTFIQYRIALLIYSASACTAPGATLCAPSWSTKTCPSSRIEASNAASLLPRRSMLWALAYASSTPIGALASSCWCNSTTSSLPSFGYFENSKQFGHRPRIK